MPLASANISQVSSYDGNALQVLSTSAAYLKYRTVETNGLANINLSNGSFRFSYAPYWNQSTGPTNWVRLVECGAFGITISPNGQYLSLQSPDASGNATTNFQGTVGSFFPNNAPIGSYWVQIVVTYSPSGSSLYCNGAFVTNGTGIINVPPLGVSASGFTIGSDSTGTYRAQGKIDEFEAFNCALGIPQVYGAQGGALAVTATNSPPTITLNWQLLNASLTVQRKLPTDSSWSTLATSVSSLSYANSTATIGQRYEYNVGGSMYVLSGINAPPVEYRGKVILLVDATVTNSLVNELSQLKSDLVGDGWTVIRHDVGRHDDGTWSNNTNNIASIKSQVVSDYNADPANTKAVLIVGHVAIPYSGSIGRDGHSPTVNPPDHQGAWPADTYYADVDGIWTDSSVNYTNLANPPQTNLPGDGKFDQDNIPTNSLGVAQLEMAVGRVDFAQMPSFTNAPAPNTKSETDLLRQYLFLVPLPTHCLSGNWVAQVTFQD